MKTTILLTLLSFSVLCLKAQSSEEKIIDIDYAANEWNNQAHSLIEKGEYQEAKALLKRAIDRNPEVLLYYENLAIACNNSDDQQGLLSCYALAKENIPDEASIFYHSGDALQNAQRYEEALADYNRAIELANQDTELLYLYYFNRGNTWLKLREYKSAQIDYDKAIALNPYHHASFVNRATARYNRRDAKGACEDWLKANELGYQPALKYFKKYCN